VLAATILGSSITFIDSTVVNVALPVLQRELETDIVGARWVVEAYSLTLSALIRVGDSLGNRWGRRRDFSTGLVLFALASAGCGLSRTTAQLIAARAVQDVGAATLVPGTRMPSPRRPTSSSSPPSASARCADYETIRAKVLYGPALRGVKAPEGDSDDGTSTRAA
jgi:MFS family permease